MSNHLFDHLFAPHADNQDILFERPGADPMTYASFIEKTGRMAHALQAVGLEPGDRVVVQAEKSVEMVILYGATIRAGGVFLPLNTAYTHDEVSYFVNDAAPRILVCDPAQAEGLAPIAAKAGARVLTLDAAGQGSLTAGLEAHPSGFEPVARAPGDLAALLYTSGTTGRSKGAMLSHDNLLSNTLALVDLWQITDQDTLIHALPIFHTHGLFVALNTSFLAGARVHFLRSFDKDAILDAMGHATMLMGVPTFYTRLLDDPRLTRERAAGMRLFVSGSAPLLAETHVAFTERTGHRILERYGMTETNMNTSNPYDGERRAGTVGQPLPGVELRLTDPETGEEVPDGAVGMIEVRGPNVFSGYWQMPEKTAAELRDNGFFITGDLGQMSEDGYLSIVGRAKDLIITGGYNVYPKEIEDVLNDLDGISESAVFGVPDADFGEAIVAAIVPLPGATPDIDAITAAVAEKLARFKHPRRYEVMEALPRNTMGKVQKNVLRERFAG
ncbi:Long-chain-fatty-acid--CoA ligase [Pseudoruegeria aquimaris]|uniref:Long-chain-fatty-acid--CoA ligase n=1 Tax=Pseudoruegeria aquimaris TaxID=393663 RepID=A0A1Y5T265_9RHOB|nr:malonyl-CoA synthase [Pseudoruegeria aquimaris]SLN50413.1 Long-chain-fatty-acid--CoA ligase [Pseudoruegeria aquimaris]